MSLLGAVKTGYVNVEVPFFGHHYGGHIFGKMNLLHLHSEKGEETLHFFLYLVQDQHLPKANITQDVGISVWNPDMPWVSEKGAQSPDWDSFRQDQWSFQSFHWTFPITWCFLRLSGAPSHPTAVRTRH